MVANASPVLRTPKRSSGTTAASSTRCGASCTIATARRSKMCARRAELAQDLSTFHPMVRIPQAGDNRDNRLFFRRHMFNVFTCVSFFPRHVSDVPPPGAMVKIKPFFKPFECCATLTPLVVVGSGGAAKCSKQFTAKSLTCP
jgi:hypothetical protein